jgi:hypothetical protein
MLLVEILITFAGIPALVGALWAQWWVPRRMGRDGGRR